MGSPWTSPRTWRHLIVRGLRAISDFETEIQLAHNNRELPPEVDTVFLMESVDFGYVSSSLAKEIARFGGDVARWFLPAVPTASRRPSRGARSDARAIIAAPASRDRPAQPGGRSDRHHLPRRAPRSLSPTARSCRSRRTSSSTRTRHSGSSTSCGSPCPRRSAPRSASTPKASGSSRRRRRRPSGSWPGPGAGRLPHRRARSHPGGGGPEPRDHRQRAPGRRRHPPRRRRIRRRRPGRARGRVVKTLQASRRGSPCSTSDGPRSKATTATAGGEQRNRRALITRPRSHPPARGDRGPAPATAPSPGTSLGGSSTTPGAERASSRSRTSRSTSATTSQLAAPDRRPRPAAADQPRDPRPRRPATRPSRSSAAAACATSSCPSTIRLEEEYLPALDLTTGRPAAGRRRARRRPPDRPPRARPRDARPRGDPAGRADRAALPARIARACASSAVERLDEGDARPSGRGHRPAAGGPARVPGRRGLTRG